MYENDIKQILKEKFEPFGFTSHEYPNAIGMWPNEQESLLWLALNADPAANFMEIGSFCGGSAVLMCLARRFLKAGPSVVSVDISFKNWNNAFNRNVYRVGKFQDISRTVCCDSGLLTKHYSGEPVSLAFIDGWHSFKAVIRDFDTVNQWLIPGGFVAFHDVAPQPYKPGQVDHFYQRALQHWDEWMAEPLVTMDAWEQDGLYHAAEARQNFFLDEAVAYILKTRNCELVEIPVLDGSTHFDRVPVYKHGTTSPYHGLVAVRKL